MLLPCLRWQASRFNRRFCFAALSTLAIVIFMLAIYEFRAISEVKQGYSSGWVSLVEKPNLSQDLPYAHSTSKSFPNAVLLQGKPSYFSESLQHQIFYHGKHSKDSLVIAIVSCGTERLDQTVVSLKSAILLSERKLHFVIMADENNRKHVQNTVLSKWPKNSLANVSFEIHPVRFPSNGEKWKKLFKVCASQRLFLPTLLPHLDSLIYIDNDVLFLSPPEEIWGFFSKMNSSQMAAMAPEHEDYSAGWYNRFAKHPFVRPLGVNSGVMLMNLTRMRSFQWETYLQPVFDQYKLEIVWGDQDIINIIFHFHTDKLYIFPCHWNYRPDHCIYTQVCKFIYKDGVKLLHGNRDAFINDKLPAFKAIYNAIKMYKLGSDIEENMLEPMIDMLGATEHTSCGKQQRFLIKSLERTLS